MENLSDQVVENIFPDYRDKLFRYLREQRRHPTSWLFLFTALAILLVAYNFVEVYLFVFFNGQLVINLVLIFWVITIVLVPFIWPLKPSDFFHDDFTKGIDPAVWETDRPWKTGLDENGKPVLTVTNSPRGGLASRCISWADYELIFDTRILKECTAWFVRAYNLNNYVMFQLTEKLIRPHKQVIGLFPKEMILDLEHHLPIKIAEWYPIRTIVRGSWVQVYVTVDDKENLVYQADILGTQEPIAISYMIGNQAAPAQVTQTVDISYRFGSFGFRLWDSEKAQFRNVRAYRLT